MSYDYWTEPRCDGSGETRYGWCRGCTSCEPPHRPTSATARPIVGPAAPRPYGPNQDPWFPYTEAPND